MMLQNVRTTLTLLAAVALASCTTEPADEIKHGYADSDGVKIHYAEAGSEPLVVMIHGFPDYWYSWRHQMDGLKDNYHVVAIDPRGYNLSDQPDGVENYDMSLLVADVAAVIRHLGEQKAIIVGHDWGGVVAWNVAFHLPDIVDKLVILNLPHPNGLARSMATNEEAFAGTAYAKVFRGGSPDDPEIFFGYPMNALTLVTVPGAGHFVQQDAAELVTSTMRWWLDARRD